MNDKRIALVTGGSSGLGLATARKFTQQGIYTIIMGRNKQRLEETAHTLGENCIPLNFDVTHLDKIPGMIKKITDREKQLDVLVNNAGINLKKDIIDVTDKEFQDVILTNLTAVFAMSREAARVMARQKCGAIINISSMAAHYGIPKVVAYTVSKSGVEGLTRAMAVELSPLGIRVNCIAPGFIETEMSAAALNQDPERKQKVLSRTPMGKLGLPEDVANAAYFLTTQDARFMTGSVITVDGGNSIGF